MPKKQLDESTKQFIKELRNASPKKRARLLAREARANLQEAARQAKEQEQK